MRRDKSHWGVFTNKLMSCLTSSLHWVVKGGWHVTFGTWQKVTTFTVTSYCCACLACYEYIKWSTRIDKLSLWQYRACIVDSLGVGVTCLLISLYYVYKASWSCLSWFLSIPIFLFEFYIYLSDIGLALSNKGLNVEPMIWLVENVICVVDG